jgi:hypothetical protein
MNGPVHTALVLRGEHGKIIDILELQPGAVVTQDDLRELMRRHGARSIESVTTTEGRRP